MAIGLNINILVITDLVCLHVNSPTQEPPPIQKKLKEVCSFR